MTKEEIEKALEDLKRIAGAQQDRRAVGGTWSESQRDNEKHGGIVPKPGAKNG